MGLYSGNGTQATATANRSLFFIENGATVRRINVFDIVVGCNATPADQSARYGMYRASTGTPAGTAVTEFAFDPADVAALSAMLSDLTAEPGTKVNGPDWPQNQRATFRFVTLPGSGIWVPATADNGFGVEVIATTSTHVPHGFVAWQE